MRVMQIVCALMIAACAVGLKPSMPLGPPADTVRIAKVDDRTVSFTVGPGWEYLPQTDSDAVVIQRRGTEGSAIGVYFQPAIPGSTVEEATARWMALMLTEPAVFTVTEVPPPVFVSEEEASFTLYGVDGQTKMVSKCRIKLLGDARSDYWVLVFSVGSESQRTESFAQVDVITDSLKLEPLEAP